MLQLILQYSGHLMGRADSLEKTLMLGKIEGRRRRGNTGWDGWMASPTQWTWVWVDSVSWSWTGRPGVLQWTVSQRVTCNWATELNWAWPHTSEQDPISPSVSPIKKLPLASYPSTSEGRQTENHHFRKLTNLIKWTTALSNSMKLWTMTWWTGHGGECCQNVVHWRRKRQATSLSLPSEPHEQYEKVKIQDTERWTPQVGRCPMLLESTGEITPERMKRWSQSKNTTQLRMWLVMDGKVQCCGEQ